MAAAEKPVIVIVHGAWHPPHFYRRLIDVLRAQGYVVLAPPMATTGLDDSIAGKTWPDDVCRIHEVLLPHLNDGREAVIVCHSQGGIAGTAAAEGHTIAERKARGLKGGIRDVVYVAALAPTERGISMFSATGNKTSSFFDQVGPFCILNEKAPEALYSDLPEEESKALVEGLVYQSKASIHEPTRFLTLDITADKTYVICTNDQALPAVAQRAWANITKCKTFEMESDHSPFMKDNTNEQLVKLIIDVASK